MLPAGDLLDTKPENFIFFYPAKHYFSNHWIFKIKNKKENLYIMHIKSVDYKWVDKSMAKKKSTLQRKPLAQPILAPEYVEVDSPLKK